MRLKAPWQDRIFDKSAERKVYPPRSLLKSSEVLSVVRRLAKVMTRHPT